MRPHWDDATRLVRGLVRVLAKVDKDGLDMIFMRHKTISKSVSKERKINIFEKAMEQGKPGKAKERMSLDVVAELNTVFNNFKTGVKNGIIKGSTVIFLTDGLWTGRKDLVNAVEKCIELFVKDLQDMKNQTADERPFSIQFVLFGQDTTAPKVFNDLDCGL
jgi:hypothetical protein